MFNQVEIVTNGVISKLTKEEYKKSPGFKKDTVVSFFDSKDLLKRIIIGDPVVISTKASYGWKTRNETSKEFLLNGELECQTTICEK